MFSSYPYRELLFAMFGTSIGLFLMRIEDKFYNRQYETSQYIKVGIAFFLTCFAVIFANKILSQTPLLISTSGPQIITGKSSPIISDSRSVFTPINTVNNLKYNNGIPNF